MNKPEEVIKLINELYSSPEEQSVLINTIQPHKLNNIQIDLLYKVLTFTESKLITMNQSNEIFKNYASKRPYIKQIITKRFPNFYSKALQVHPKYKQHLQPKGGTGFIGMGISFLRMFLPSFIKPPGKSLDMGSIFSIILIVIGIVILCIVLKQTNIFKSMFGNSVSGDELLVADIPELSDFPSEC